MNKIKSILQDKLFYLGLVLIAFSLVIHFLVRELVSQTPGSFTYLGVFFVNYVISVVYFLLIIFSRIKPSFFRFKRISHRQFIASLVLFSISCFTINIPISIFSDFVTWTNIYILVIHASLLLFCFEDILPPWGRTVNYFFMGTGVVLTLYFTIYLGPLVGIGFLGSFLFGLPMHLVAPLIMFITFWAVFYRNKRSLKDKISFYTGIIIPIIVLAIFSNEWQKTKNDIHQIRAHILSQSDINLPEWIKLSQELPQSIFSDRIIKGDLMYETDMFGAGDFFNGMELSQDRKQHDPLVTAANAVVGDLNISRSDRLNILRSQYDMRHETGEKLWSGKGLETSSVFTNIQVLADYRLAYTQKVIRIKSIKNNGSMQKEAFYTFHLPEGSVASSLSLWIEGVEEKSRLTTKSKAKKAYTTIVGKERRDPSIMHWQEGNTITVKVFPCTYLEERMFKIGITSPLKYRNDELVLENIFFEGPDTQNAIETTEITFSSDEKLSPLLPGFFEKKDENSYTYHGDYKNYWEVRCNATPISSSLFSFNGSSYQMVEQKPSWGAKSFDNIYLDINKSWTMEEFTSLYQTVKNKNIFVYTDQTIVRMTDSNKNQIFERMSRLNFSLFALNKIVDTEHSLLISKSTVVSPNIQDIESTPFFNEIRTDFSKSRSLINHFSLSDQLSPFLQTMREFQIFNYDHGDIAKLNNLLQQEKFITANTNSQEVFLPNAQAVIIKDSTGIISTQAPDHLLRIYAYNKIMQDYGRQYLTKEEVEEDDFINLANEAFIVTPISSLIVLETIKDYDRFDIGKNKSSLQNASANSSGAVPEPHEWALILIFSFTLIFLYTRK